MYLRDGRTHREVCIFDFGSLREEGEDNWSYSISLIYLPIQDVGPTYPAVELILKSVSWTFKLGS